MSKANAVFSKNDKEVEKIPARGFVNWKLWSKDQETCIKSTKGFPISGNPEYTNRSEDALIKLAEANGGTYMCTFDVEVKLNKTTEEYDLSGF